jgi:predicted nucleic acid-binding protein
MRYKVFVDTNILLSGIFFEGNESHIHKLKEAESLIRHKKDVPILAAVLYTKPDYFLTGDAHFFTDSIKNMVQVITTRDLLAKVK